MWLLTVLFVYFRLTPLYMHQQEESTWKSFSMKTHKIIASVNRCQVSPEMFARTQNLTVKIHVTLAHIMVMSLSVVLWEMSTQQEVVDERWSSPKI